MSNNIENNDMKKRVSISQQKDSKFVSNINENIKTDIIIITKDKLENILLKVFNNIKRIPDWKNPLCIFLTTGISLLTADFKNFLISKEIWKALFLVIMVISGICCLVNLIRAIHYQESVSIEDLINKITKGEEWRDE